MTNKRDEELAELRSRIDELERAAKPPEPFKPDPDWAPINPIDRVGMSPEAMRDLALPDQLVRGVVHDNRAPQGPSSAGAIPSSQQVSNIRPGGGPAGWAPKFRFRHRPAFTWSMHFALPMT